MKQKSVQKSGRSLAVAAFAILMPAGVAYADITFLGNRIPEPSRVPAMDYSQYDRLEFLGNVQLIPKTRGVQGPMRSDSLAGTDTMDAEHYDKLDILGNVFWFPKTGESR